jgi:hypothetical protein
MPLFVIPLLHRVRGELQPESSLFSWLQPLLTPGPALDPDPSFSVPTTFREAIKVERL